MTNGLAVSPNVDFVFVIFCGFAVNRVVEVHALGVLAPPIAPNQVSAGAKQSDDHCGKDRDCVFNTHTATTHGGSVNTAQGTQSGTLSTHPHTNRLCTLSLLY